MAGVAVMTREQVLEHALRALIHAQPDGDAILAARWSCTDKPGHSVLAALAADEIDRLNADQARDLDFSSALPPVDLPPGYPAARGGRPQWPETGDAGQKNAPEADR
jgi:hypothetical protein